MLVSRNGLTVFARLGDLGPFGQGNLTIEAAVYGALISLKVTLLILITTLAGSSSTPMSCCEVFAVLLPLGAHRLARHAHDPPARRRLPATLRGAAHPSRRCTRGRARRVALLGAIVGGSLDRAMDVAATLELRGFAAGAAAATACARSVVAPRHRLRELPPRPSSPSRSSAGSGVASFTAYPLIHGSLGAGDLRAVLRADRRRAPALL